jgi:hypothetical protein
VGRFFGGAFLAAVFFAPFAAGRTSSKLPGSTMSALIMAFGRFRSRGQILVARRATTSSRPWTAAPGWSEPADERVRSTAAPLAAGDRAV